MTFGVTARTVLVMSSVGACEAAQDHGYTQRRLILRINETTKSRPCRRALERT